eukprot:6195588-Pleurochrysis_carterae.AAC.2
MEVAGAYWLLWPLWIGRWPHHPVTLMAGWGGVGGRPAEWREGMHKVFLACCIRNLWNIARETSRQHAPPARLLLSFAFYARFADFAPQIMIEHMCQKPPERFRALEQLNASARQVKQWRGTCQRLPW